MRAESRAVSRDVEQRLDVLERQNDEMKLYLAALVRYLATKGLIDLNEFARLVDEVDAEDGSADGRYEGNLP